MKLYHVNKVVKRDFKKLVNLLAQIFDAMYNILSKSCNLKEAYWVG